MRKSLYIVRGPISVGKSSVSQALRAYMPDSISVVETDLIKRMIDPTGSSNWRRNVANNSAAFIVEQLLQVPRSAVVETHTKYREEVDRLAVVAMRNEAELINVLLTAPLEVCQARAATRVASDITYKIDDQMVADYYCNLDPRSEDLVFDTTYMSPQEIADNIINFQ